MKKYRLKKDLPDIKAGAIYERDAENSIYECRLGTNALRFHNKYIASQVIENSPDWFEEVDEVKEFKVGAWVKTNDGTKGVVIDITPMYYLIRVTTGRYAMKVLKDALTADPDVPQWTDADMFNFGNYCACRDADEAGGKPYWKDRTFYLADWQQLGVQEENEKS